jgi:hypothetical protein
VVARGGSGHHRRRAMQFSWRDGPSNGAVRATNSTVNSIGSTNINVTNVYSKAVINNTANNKLRRESNIRRQQRYKLVTSKALPIQARRCFNARQALILCGPCRTHAMATPSGPFGVAPMAVRICFSKFRAQ